MEPEKGEKDTSTAGIDRMGLETKEESEKQKLTCKDTQTNTERETRDWRQLDFSY